MTLVEIDYLHQTPPVNPRLASYPNGDPEALPYYITVDVPQPTPARGTVQVFGAHVDTPLPRIDISLSEGAAVRIDFTEVYNIVFERMRAFSLLVDYDLDPVAFDRYHADDQQKIRTILEGVRAK